MCDSIYMHVHLCAVCVPMFTKTRKGGMDFYNWSYGLLQVVLCILSFVRYGYINKMINIYRGFTNKY